MNCLVFGVKNAVGLGTIRSLWCEGHSVICADTRSIAQGLYYEDVKPYLLESDFSFDEVLEIIDSEEVDVVFVSEREYLETFADNFPDIANKDAFLPMPDKDVLYDVLDKRELCRRFEDITPRVFSKNEDIQFPVAVRGRYTRREGGIPVVDSQSDLKFELKKAEQQEIKPLIQEYIPENGREEYLVSTVCDTGSNKESTIFKILSKSWDFTGNIKMMETATNEEVLSKAESIIDELSLSETHVKLLFRMNEGVPKLLSANPILCELQGAGRQVGRNTAGTLCDISTGESVSVSDGYSTGVSSIRDTVYMSVKKDRMMGVRQ